MAAPDLPGMDPPHRKVVGAVNAVNALVVVAQGLWVRRRLEILPPAAGPATGTAVGADEGAPPLRLGILGDSTAAGCGVDTHETSIAGALARALAARTGRAVRWQVVGEYGATIRRIRHRLTPQLEGEYDVVLVLAGVNDVLAGRTPTDWREDLKAVVSHVAGMSARVVVAGTPPLETFPSLPRRLGRHLAARGRELDLMTREVCDATPNAVFAATDASLVDANFFARDRFHPGRHGYALWADVLGTIATPEPSASRENSDA